MPTFISKSLEETESLAQKFLASLRSEKGRATVLLFDGDLGSGKTTFTQALARALGVKNNLTSPTFVLMKSYKIPKEITERKGLSVKNLIHIDAYRLNSGRDLEVLGWSDLVANPENLIVLEWPERVADIFDGTEQKLHFKFVDEKTREIQWPEKLIKQK